MSNIQEARRGSRSPKGLSALTPRQNPGTPPDKTPGVQEINTITRVEKFPNGKEFHTIVDQDTGEVLHQTWRVFRTSEGGRPKKKSSFPFARIWLHNLIQVVQERHLSNSEAGILFKLMAFLDWQSTMLVHPETGRAINTNGIAQYLGMDPDHVSKQLNRLVEKGFLGKFIAGKGRPHRYHFNNNLAFFGKHVNDVHDRGRFNQDCSYSPRVRIPYDVETKHSRMVRRDF